MNAAADADPQGETVVSGVVDRGPNFAVYQSVTTSKATDGTAATRTNSFTLLDNNLHLLENGIWKECEDLVEASPDGAIARNCPDRAVFASDLNVAEVFRVETPEGRLFRGGLRQVRITDDANGKTAIVGNVKASVPAKLVPPNQILFEDAFDGISADVVLVWKHNQFSQDLVLKAQPELPEGLSPASSRLEVVTEIITDTEPEVRSQETKSPDGRIGTDDTVIDFGSIAMVVGKAYAANDQAAASVGGTDFTDAGTPVAKRWVRTDDGLHYLVESVGWNDLTAITGKTGASIQGSKPSPGAVEPRIQARWPARPPRGTTSKPIELAGAPYQPSGAVLDFVTISGGGTPTTFATGTTYYIKTSYYSGAAVTFQPGCVIKYKDNAYMLLYGTPSFPSSGTPPIFTSRNDNNQGDWINGVTGETDSDGNAVTHRAAQQLWIYYVNFNTTVQNCRFRYAKKSIQYDSNPGVTATHFVSNSIFEQLQTAIANNLSGGSVLLTSDKKCVVTSEVLGSGTTSGSMAANCGVVSETFVNYPDKDNNDLLNDPNGDSNKNSQSECSFVVLDSNRIVAAFWDTHRSMYNLGVTTFDDIKAPRSTSWAVSTDGGASFLSHNPLPPATPTILDEGDVGDPQIVRQKGVSPNPDALYLVVNPSREGVNHTGFRVWKSTDNGATFSQISHNVFGTVTDYADKPAIQVNNNIGPGQPTGTIYIAGRVGQDLLITSSADNGTIWASPKPLAHGQAQAPDIVVALDGTVYVFFHQPGVSYTSNLMYTWKTLADGDWHPAVPIVTHANTYPYYSTLLNASTDPQRSNSGDANDFFGTDGFPRAVQNPINHRLYLVYADLPTPDGSPRGVDRGDIFMNEGVQASDGSLRWTIPRRVNTDTTSTDQWNPSIACNPNDGTIFVGYYSRQEDAANSWIKAYGTKVRFTSSVTLGTNSMGTAVNNATWESFAISASAFQNFYPGSQLIASSPWLFDNVWLTGGVWLDADARIVPASLDAYEVLGGSGENHFTADDYTSSAADADNFYFAWRDCGYTAKVKYDGVTYYRKDANVRLGKVRK